MKPIIDSLPVLILYPHSRCNCRCVMCDIWKETTAAEIQAAELKSHIADFIALGVQWVVFSGGEPLMHSDLFSLSSMLRAHGIRTTLLSTGLLLGRHSSKIVDAFDEVIVSLDGPREVHNKIRRVPGAFERMSEGITAIHHLRPEFPIAGRCTVQKLNAAHLNEVVRAARELGLNSISFLAADVTSTAFNRAAIWPAERQVEVALDAGELDCLEQEIEKLIRARECVNFVRESPQKLRRIADHFRSRLVAKEPFAPVCNAPWVSAVWEADGTLRPCFFHAPIGRVQDGIAFVDVLNSPAAVKFRTELDVATNPICRQCVCSLNWNGLPAVLTVASTPLSPIHTSHESPPGLSEPPDAA